jgi:phage terminase small subunit
MGQPGRSTLTLKQRRFVEEYAADGNAVQAYFRAFGRETTKGNRRSYRGAQSQASVLLSNPIILAELEQANGEYARRVRVDKERVLAELAALAFSDPDDIYEPDPDNNDLPAPKRWRDIPAMARKAIQSVKVKRRRLKGDKDATAWEVEELEYRFHSKTDALDKLCKKLGFYGGEDADTAAGALLRGLIGDLIAKRTESAGEEVGKPGEAGGGGPPAHVADAEAPGSD